MSNLWVVLTKAKTNITWFDAKKGKMIAEIALILKL